MPTSKVDLALLTKVKNTTIQIKNISDANSLFDLKEVLKVHLEDLEKELNAIKSKITDLAQENIKREIQQAKKKLEAKELLFTKKEPIPRPEERTVQYQLDLNRKEARKLEEEIEKGGQLDPGMESASQKIVETNSPPINHDNLNAPLPPPIHLPEEASSGQKDRLKNEVPPPTPEVQHKEERKKSDTSEEISSANLPKSELNLITPKNITPPSHHYSAERMKGLLADVEKLTETIKVYKGNWTVALDPPSGHKQMVVSDGKQVEKFRIHNLMMTTTEAGHDDTFKVMLKVFKDTYEGEVPRIVITDPNLQQNWEKAFNEVYPGKEINLTIKTNKEDLIDAPSPSPRS